MKCHIQTFQTNILNILNPYYHLISSHIQTFWMNVPPRPWIIVWHAELWWVYSLLPTYGRAWTHRVIILAALRHFHLLNTSKLFEKDRRVFYVLPRPLGVISVTKSSTVTCSKPFCRTISETSKIIYFCMECFILMLILIHFFQTKLRLLFS
jgi:hypothetical protein